MQKCAFLPGKMQKSGVELGKTNVHVAVVKSTKIAAEEINKVRNFGLFSMPRNLKNEIRYKFRYKLQKFFVSNLYLELKEVYETIENTEEKIKSAHCPKTVVKS